MEREGGRRGEVERKEKERKGRITKKRRGKEKGKEKKEKKERNEMNTTPGFNEVCLFHAGSDMSHARIWSITYLYVGMSVMRFEMYKRI